MGKVTRASLLLLLCSVAAAAQTHQETVTVEVVDVPVYVRRGTEPVRDLTRDDFELFVNGKKQAIEYFDVTGDEPPSDAPVTAGKYASPAARAVPMRERRLFVLLFDFAFTRSYMTRRAQTAAAALIDGAGPRDYFAVATFSPAAGLRYTLPFTRDKAALKAAVLQLRSRETYDPLSLVAVVTRADLVPNEPRDPRADPTDKPAPTWTEAHSHDVTSDPEKEEAITPKGQINAEKESGGNTVYGILVGLGALASNLGRLEGQKHVFFMSEGFDVTTFNDPRALFKETPGLYMQQLLEGVFHEYRAAGVFLHTLDPGGLRAIGESPRGASLWILASGGGGQAINDRNDLHAALSDLTSSYRYGYVLGFRPTNPRKGENKIVVKVKASGVTVDYRHGFSGEGPPAEKTNGLYLADIVLNDVPQTGLAATMEIRKGRVTARLPMKAISAQLGGKGSAELLVYLFDVNGQPVDFRRREVAVTSNDVEQVDLQLGLKPGTYALKTLLRVAGSIGFTRANIKVGPPAGG